MVSHASADDVHSIAADLLPDLAMDEEVGATAQPRPLSSHGPPPISQRLSTPTSHAHATPATLLFRSAPSRPIPSRPFARPRLFR